MLKIVPSHATEIDVGTLLDRGAGSGGRGLIVRVTEGGFVWLMTVSAHDINDGYFFTSGDCWTGMFAKTINLMKKNITGKIQAGDTFYRFGSLKEFCEAALANGWKLQMEA